MKDIAAKIVLDNMPVAHRRACPGERKMSKCPCSGCIKMYGIDAKTLERYLNNSLNLKNHE